MEQILRRRVEGRLQVDFHGDYWSDDELVEMVDDWIDGGFCDRDNLCGYRFDGDSSRLSEGQPDYLSEYSREVKWRVQRYDADQWDFIGQSYESREEADGARDGFAAKFPGMPLRIGRIQTLVDIEDDTHTGGEN